MWQAIGASELNRRILRGQFALPEWLSPDAVPHMHMLACTCTHACMLYLFMALRSGAHMRDAAYVVDLRSRMCMHMHMCRVECCILCASPLSMHVHAACRPT